MPALVKLDNARENVPIDVRRAEAVAKTRELKNAVERGLITEDEYRSHLRELVKYVTAEPQPSFEWYTEAPTRAVSGERLKVVPEKPSVDTLLITYLLGIDGYEESDDTRLLGDW
jgi:hypothetical protein